MASSPSHKLGELIGDLFEAMIIDYLRPIVTDCGYYLDYRHPRTARNNAKEVKWTDSENNQHKLDIVVEEYGSEEHIGHPRAFIEIAWRRYTKHSKNKVQEISGAILPLVNCYKKYTPFYCAVLSGKFTNNSIEQLQSQGFFVVYFNYNEIIQTFSSIGFNISWEENTDEDSLRAIVHNFNEITNDQENTMKNYFLETHADKLLEFREQLLASLRKRIEQILIIPLHGTPVTIDSILAAREFINDYNETNCCAPLFRYEIQIRYNNGDEYNVKCHEKITAINFLNEYI